MDRIVIFLIMFFLIVLMGCNEESSPVNPVDPVNVATRNIKFKVTNSTGTPINLAYVATSISTGNLLPHNKNEYTDVNGIVAFKTDILEGGGKISYTISKAGFSTKTGSDDISFTQDKNINIKLGSANDEADLVPVDLYIKAVGVPLNGYAYYNQKTGEKDTEILLPKGVTSDTCKIYVTFEMTKPFAGTNDVKNVVYIDDIEVGHNNYIPGNTVGEHQYKVYNIPLSLGTHSCKQIVDVTGNIAEANEYNNTMSFNFTIKNDTVSFCE